MMFARMAVSDALLWASVAVVIAMTLGASLQRSFTKERTKALNNDLELARRRIRKLEGELETAQRRSVIYPEATRPWSWETDRSR